MTLFGIAEQEPRRDSRIVLSDEVDEAGVPKVSVRTAHSDRDADAIEAMFRDCEALAEAAGLDEVGDRYSTYDRSNAAHVAGGCRMGASAEDGVTDGVGRVLRPGQPALSATPACCRGRAPATPRR